MKKILLGALIALLVTLGFGLVSATSASAGTGCDVYGPSCPTPNPQSGGETTTTVVTTTTAPASVEALTVTAAPASAAAPASTAPESSLAFTGGDIGGLVAIALVLVGLGFVVVRTSRRRATN